MRTPTPADAARVRYHAMLDAVQAAREVATTTATTLAHPIDWQCAVNRALIDAGHAGYHGPNTGTLSDDERDAGYAAHRAGLDPLTFARAVEAVRAQPTPP